MANTKKRCKQCKKYFQAEGMVSVPAGNFCTIGHAIEFANEKRAKERERSQTMKAELKHKIETGVFKEPKISDRLKLCQTLVNKYVRLRDHGKPCISCDWPDDGSNARHASHFRSVGSCSSVRFNTLNIHASCAQCNTSKSGNISQYRPRLIEKIGVELVEWVERQPIQKKYTKEYLIKFETTFKKLCKREQRKIDNKTQWEQ